MAARFKLQVNMLVQHRLNSWKIKGTLPWDILIVKPTNNCNILFSFMVNMYWNDGISVKTFGGYVLPEWKWNDLSMLLMY